MDSNYSSQSSSYLITTLSSSSLRTDGRDGHEWLNDADGCVPFYCRLRRRECCMLWASYSQPTVPRHYLPPARLVIHRQTSAHERRKGTRNVQLRSGILVYFCPPPRHHWLWIMVELHTGCASPGG